MRTSVFATLITAAVLAGCTSGAESEHGERATLFVYHETEPEEFITLTPADLHLPLDALRAALDEAAVNGDVQREISSEDMNVMLEFLNQRWQEAHGEPAGGRRHVKYGEKFYNIQFAV